ncbi:MAG: alpha/beta fold hydrolase [Candidatus Lokiarchaeota archaeon]|nr:alpha/beta fold hydrolase [Candidatus Lokiarchaeota archaeon]
MNVSKKSLIVITMIGGLLAISSVIGLVALDSDIVPPQKIEFYDENHDLLVGSYYEGSEEAGVLLLEGFGSDQTALQSLVSEYYRMGLHIFTFDFSGHGRSPGALGFDNAATDRLALQALEAKEQFKTLSGLGDSQIVIFGHSMGSRVALQSAVIDTANVAGLVLFGTQVSLATNVQSEFFTGVQDANLEWVQSLNGSTPSTDILLLIGEFDDILPPESAQLLLNNLTEGGTSTYSRELVILPWLFHNYEVYNPEAIDISKNFIADTFSISPPSYPNTAVVRKALWLTGIIGIFLLLGFADPLMSTYDSGRGEYGIEIVDERKFLTRKLVLWLGAIPIFILLAMVFFMIPIGIPVFNIVYVGFIGSYGILFMILYWQGKVGGTKGNFKLDMQFDISSLTNSKFLLALVVASAIILWSAIFGRSGIYFIFPLNERFVWLIIFTIFTTIGFYVGQVEFQIALKREVEGSRLLIWNTLIGFLPFFFLTGLWYALGSTSGMIGSLQGLLILALVMVGGNIIQRLGNRTILTAVFQAFLLQLLVLPQGVLFAMF